MVRVQNNLGTLGALIPIFEIELQHGGRTKRVNAGFDTGASRTTVIMGPELAQELGLKLENPHKILGFGGSQTAYDAHLESVRVVDAPCSLHDTRVEVAKVPSGLTDVLIGEDFFKAVKGAISYEKNPAGEFVCQGIAAVGKTPGTPTWVWAVGGVAVAIVLGFVILSATDSI